MKEVEKPGFCVSPRKVTAEEISRAGVLIRAQRGGLTLYKLALNGPNAGP
jgi:hypothetical protein